MAPKTRLERQRERPTNAKAKTAKAKAKPKAAEQNGQAQDSKEAAAMSDLFSGARLIVVKVGSALLVDGATGELRRDWLASLCADVAALKREGRK